MEANKKLSQESVNLLVESSLRSIPFNVILAALASAILVHSHAPRLQVDIWFVSIVLLSIVRWVYSQILIGIIRRRGIQNNSLYIFIALTFCMGALWGGCYYFFYTYFTPADELIITLILGGMACGSLTSLSVYVPAYCAYILPMFIPMIALNIYIQGFNHIIFAATLILFILMLLVSARISSKLLHKTFQLAREKDELIAIAQETNQRLEESIEEVKKLSVTDSLTGLYNRRYFDHALKSEFNRAKRNDYPLNLVLIDVDNFKYINDTFGHPYGDIFLVQIANHLKHAMRRSNDIVFRLGGDEFAALMANTSMEDAIRICKEVQQQFKEDSDDKPVSLSIAVIYIPSNTVSELEYIISAADETLYKAKKTGKNRIISHDIMTKMQ